MSKESLSKLDKKLIFRETFTDENSVRANGGVPTNVVFEKGVGKFSNAFIKYRNNLNGVYTIKVRLTSFDPTNDYYIFTSQNPNNTGIGYITRLTATTLFLSSGTCYVDGIATTTVSPTSKEIVVTGITLKNNDVFVIGVSRSQAAQYFKGSIELFEIYEGTLTAQEVKNLYENKRYKQLMPHGEILGPELIVNGDFSNGTTGWTALTNIVIENSAAKIDYSLDNPTSILIQNILTSNKIYRIKFSYKLTNINNGVRYYKGNTYQSPYPTYLADNLWHDFSETFVSDGTQFKLRAASTPTGDLLMYIDNISVKEVLSNVTPILDVDAFDGVIKNRLSGGQVGLNLLSPLNFTSGWTISNSNIINSNSFITTAINGYISKTAILTAGKGYRVVMEGIISQGTLEIAGSNTGVVYKSISDLSFRSIFDFICEASASGLRIKASNLGATVVINNISIQEVIPSVIPTSVQVVKDGGVNVMRFNGSTSKIDCGSYNGLTGDITISCWVKSIVKPNFSVFISNGKLYYYFRWATVNVFRLGSSGNGGTYGESSIKNDINGRYYHILSTRKADGKITHYINGIVSGTQDQNSGIPTIGTTNILIGADISGLFNELYNGNIAQLQIFSGIMSQAEISQLYTSQKSKYNL